MDRQLDPSNPLSDAARALVASRRRVQAACLECGQPFTGIKNRRFCSAACRWKWNNRRLNQKRFEERHARMAELGRQKQPEGQP